jgi:UDP-N-acetyl-D-mannosaminuronic acid transferase (WecB/TagA/CpsF family)
MQVSYPFGLTLSMDSARQIARVAVQHLPADWVALVVTRNIDHIATIRRSPPLARAYRNAARVVCDGWPVQAYARWCGLRVARVAAMTGYPQTDPARSLRRRASTTLHRISEGLGARPPRVNLAGLKP